MKIVIIGGGFAGLNLAKKLLNQKGIFVTLVDRNNYNFFSALNLSSCYCFSRTIKY